MYTLWTTTTVWTTGEHDARRKEEEEEEEEVKYQVKSKPPPAATARPLRRSESDCAANYQLTSCILSGVAAIRLLQVLQFRR